MSKIMISELTETTSAPDTSFIAIDNGTTTNKITVANYNENANATAKSYAEAAQGYANDALSAKNDAVSAKTDTQTLVGNASDYANAASTSASSAAGSASEASGYVGAAQTSASNAAASARAAASSAAGIEDQVKLAKSWAVGNTGVRAGEATDNAMYWAGQAAAAAGGGVVSFNGRTGTVLPDSGDYSASQITHGESDVATEIEALATDISELELNKLDTYASASTRWDSTPTNGSTKPVTSGGVYTAIENATPDMTGATSLADGAHGLVPQPLIADEKKFLRGDGMWETPVIEKSYVGMVIFSTTLNTADKVKAFYGGTTWIQHSGYMLRGAASGVVANSATKTGGADTHTLTTNQMPAHSHGSYGWALVNDGSGDYPVMGAQTSSGTQKSTRNSGGGQSHNTLPNYKSVYIWERTA